MPIERVNPVPPLPSSETQDFEDIEIDIEGMETDEPEAPPPPTEFNENLASHLDTQTLTRIGSDLRESIREDERSRSDWEKTISEGMKLLGFNPDNTADEIFEDSCTVTHPLLSESIVKYQARARSQLLPPGGPVKTMIIGRRNEALELQARRVKDFLNYQLLVQMPEYVPGTDRLTFYQGMAGVAFTKVFIDPHLGRPSRRFVKPQDFIINNSAEDLRTATRYTERIVMPLYRYRAYIHGGYFIDPDSSISLGETLGSIEEVSREIEGRREVNFQEDDAVEIFECHTYLDLPEEASNIDDRTEEEREHGILLPYIVTLTEDGTVLSVRRNWQEADIARMKREFYIKWSFVPGLGFYDYGLIHLIGGLTKSATAVTRQLIDAGSFANLPAGLKAHGIRWSNDKDPIRPGEWRDVNSPNPDLHKSLIPLPYKEPSSTLFNLLGFIVQAGQKFADSTEQVVSGSTNYGPVGTTLALLEESGKLFSAIHERLFDSQKQELQLLASLNAELGDTPYPFEAIGGRTIAEDFDERIDILPITDPRAPTEAHRLAKAQAVLQIASQTPNLHMMPEVIKEVYNTLGVDEPERFFMPKPPPPQPADPVTENQFILTGKPVVTAPYQDHDAHIQVHKNLLLPQFIGNPNIYAMLEAHIMEHIAAKYRIAIEQAIGQPIPQAQGNPELENQIALLAAQAAPMIKADIDVPNMDPALAVEMQNIEARREASKLEHERGMMKIFADIDRARMMSEAQTARNQDQKAIDIAKIRTNIRETAIKAKTELEKMRNAADKKRES